MTTATPTEQTPAEAIAECLAAHPGATAAELADAAGIGRSTAAKSLAAMEHQGTARRSAGVATAAGGCRTAGTPPSAPPTPPPPRAASSR